MDNFTPDNAQVLYMEEFKISMAKGKGGHGESINKAATSSEEPIRYLKKRLWEIARLCADAGSGKKRRGEEFHKKAQFDDSKTSQPPPVEENDVQIHCDEDISDEHRSYQATLQGDTSFSNRVQRQAANVGALATELMKQLRRLLLLSSLSKEV
ncbi:hypothetical protein DL95DRAFT_408848 [Leptodontidium sp. 2 PMI_412]|nr:hypothetical protein DL95DRAFT_408848 [Leptodontidium sp. 2 PMI_412]